MACDSPTGVRHKKNNINYIVVRPPNDGKANRYSTCVYFVVSKKEYNKIMNAYTNNKIKLTKEYVPYTVFKHLVKGKQGMSFNEAVQYAKNKNLNYENNRTKSKDINS